jgi:ABC-type multidrug transport system fused ATPase/permease subunit
MPPTDRASPAVAAPGHPAAVAPVAPPELPPLFDAGRRRLLLALVGIGLLQAALAAGAALGVRAMVDAWGIGTRAMVWAPGPWAPWVAWGVVVIACALIMFGLRVAAGRWSESLGQRYVAAVRLALMHHLFRLPPRRHQQMRHGHLMARLTGDLAALHRWAGRTVAPLLVASASFVLLAATLAWLAPAVAAGAAAACAPLVGVAWWASVRLERSLRAERVQRWALAGQVGERLAEAAVVQVHGQAGRELRRLRRRQQRLHDAAVVRARHAAVLKAMPPAAGLLVMGLLAGWGGAQVAAGAWGGRNLPRVLRARLALARALVDPPAVLLIDDFDDLLDSDAAADAPPAMLLAQPPCTIVIATRRPDWAARCAQRWPLGPLPEAGPPRVLELAHAA